MSGNVDHTVDLRFEISDLYEAPLV